MKRKNLLFAVVVVLAGVFTVAETAHATSHDVEWVFGNNGFADFSTAFSSADGRLFYADLDTEINLELILGADDRTLDLYTKGFGQDADGEIYVLVGTYYGPFNTSGSVLKLVDLCTAGLSGDTNNDCEVDLLDLTILVSTG